MNQITFFLNFKRLSVVKNSLRPESAPLCNFKGNRTHNSLVDKRTIHHIAETIFTKNFTIMFQNDILKPFHKKSFYLLRNSQWIISFFRPRFSFIFFLNMKQHWQYPIFCHNFTLQCNSTFFETNAFLHSDKNYWNLHHSLTFRIMYPDN